MYDALYFGVCGAEVVIFCKKKYLIFGFFKFLLCQPPELEIAGEFVNAVAMGV